VEFLQVNIQLFLGSPELVMEEDILRLTYGEWVYLY
jgi:hypothetical protein